MADSFVVYTATANQTMFTVPFPYFEQSDVVVQVDAIPMLTPADYTWSTAGSIKMRVGVPEGATVSIRRLTSPDTRLVAFNNGSVLTAQDLNTAAIQTFYRTQELQDQLNLYIGEGVARYSITGVNPFVTPDDLLNAAADAALQTTIAQALLSATSDIQTNANSILDQTNRVDTLQSALDVLTSGIPGGIGTYLTNETNARIDGDQALASTFDLMGAVSGAGTTFVLNTANVYVDPSTSMADKFAGLESTLGDNSAAITDEATTRATADSALSTSITGLTASVASNSAAIASEATTRATADSATATTISALTTTVNGNTASISTNVSSINGLEAQFVVKIDVNGHVAGFGLASGAGGTSDFTVVANKFSIIDPGNGLSTPKVPFTVSGGVVSMANVVIGGALIQNATITGAKLVNATIGTAQIANAAITNALIGNAAVDTAQIANLAVTNAHIAHLAVDSVNIINGAVDTGHIAANAITNDDSAVQGSAYNIPSGGGGNALTLSYTTTGGKLLVLARADLGVAAAGSGGTSSGTLTFTVAGSTYDAVTCSVDAGPVGQAEANGVGLSGFAVVTLAAGTYTIALHGTMTGQSAQVANGKLFVIEFFK